MTTEKLLRVRDVAERLQVTTQHIYGLMKDGKLPYVRVGQKSVRIPQDGLDKYLELLNAKREG